MTESIHKTVLLSETLDALALSEGHVVFEGTGGSGGLSREIAKKIGSKGTLIITDLDNDALQRINSNLAGLSCQVILLQENFKDIISIISKAGFQLVDRIVLDLGLSTEQIKQSGRGFSFEKDEPLSMTFRNPSQEGDLNAYDVVNTWGEESLADIFWGFGGEKKSRKIAHALVLARKEKLIKTSAELAVLVSRVMGGRRGAIHPATKVFQAIRIAVNDELGALRTVLRGGWEVLNRDGRIVVISFHELEDREVKNFFKEKISSGEGQIQTAKPISPNRGELRDNPSSRSAKLRVIAKI
ncbi:MAG TPA: 16S rRNA (cytosine(1402)-N(4))-methyltransferase RsmH [Candidatus Paceibacterota bacterium]